MRIYVFLVSYEKPRFDVSGPKYPNTIIEFQVFIRFYGWHYAPNQYKMISPQWYKKEPPMEALCYNKL